MKHLRVACVALWMIFLAGCSASGLGGRVMVKAIYIEREEQYEARLLVLEAEPNADTGQVSEQARCLAGSGQTVYAALQDAEQGESRRLFYGQNELLFIGPELMKNGVFNACRYLASDTSGRPNMAVYGLDASPEAFERLQEDGTTFLRSVQQLEKRGVFKTYLYQFGEQSGNGLIPSLSAEGGNAAFEKLTLYSAGKPAAVWKGAKAQLARLLAGQAETLELSLEKLNVSFQIRAPKLSFEPVFAEKGMELNVRFSGAIQRLVSPEGAALPGQNRRLEQDIDEQVQRMLNALVRDTLSSGNDVFRLQSYLSNLDETLCREMEADGHFAQTDVVKISCLLRMV